MEPTFLSLLKADATREQLEKWCRGQTQVMWAGDDRNLCRVLGKYLMYVHASDNALTPHLSLNGIWESWITMAIARHLKPGMRCMDVGACYGYYSLLMSDIVGREGHVEAWEPYWPNYVRMNALMNGLDVTVARQAMGTSSGELWCEQPPLRCTFNAGAMLMVDCNTRSGLPSTPRSPVRAPAAQQIDLIKIDVEGAEVDVWQALAGVREVSPSLTVCMEFTPSKHADPEAFIDTIERDGFDLGAVGHDGVPRSIALRDALLPDTGDFRMLWLKKKS